MTLLARTFGAALCVLAGMSLAGMSLAVPVHAETLKASHQWPAGQGDARDEMVRLIAKEVGAANVGLDVKVYPNASLVKPKDQWDALVRGQIDIAVFPLDYAAGKVPQFSATLMPGLVRNSDRARRLNASPFMDSIKKLIMERGVVVLTDAWLGGAFASKKNCITSPETVRGQVTRAAGPAFERMLAGAGASISSMASSDIYAGLQTGILDAANTSSGSFVSYRLYEQVKCLTAPGQNALWFMYEPILMSKKTWDRMNEAQKKVLLDAGKRAEEYFDGETKKIEQEIIGVFKKSGVQVVEMSAKDYDAWLAIAKRTSYKEFATKVPGGQELIDQALAVK